MVFKGIAEEIFVYEKLMDAALSIISRDKKTHGVSDAEELANHAFMQLKTKRRPLKEKMSYQKEILAAKRVLTSGTSPARDTSGGELFCEIKYGRLVQACGIEQQVFARESLEKDSDLSEVLPLILGMMTEKSRLIVHSIQPFSGNVSAYAKAVNIPQQTAHDRVHKARHEFLGLIPRNCNLYTTSRRLRRRFKIGEFNVN